MPFELCPNAVWSVLKRTLIFLTLDTSEQTSKMLRIGFKRPPKIFSLFFLLCFWELSELNFLFLNFFVQKYTVLLHKYTIFAVRKCKFYCFT